MKMLIGLLIILFSLLAAFKMYANIKKWDEEIEEIYQEEIKRRNENES